MSLPIVCSKSGNQRTLYDRTYAGASACVSFEACQRQANLQAVKINKILSSALAALLKRWGSRSAKQRIWDKEFESGKWASRQAPTVLVDLVMGKLNQGGRVLDLGCGAGQVEVALRHKGWMGWYTGVDISESAIRLAKTVGSPSSTWVVSDLEKFSSPTKYDAILLIESIYYLPVHRVAAFLDRLPQLLSPNGCIVVRIWDRKKHAQHIRVMKEKFPQSQERVVGDTGVSYLIVRNSLSADEKVIP